jgi:hypothetical protein
MNTRFDNSSGQVGHERRAPWPRGVNGLALAQDAFTPVLRDLDVSIITTARATG